MQRVLLILLIAAMGVALAVGLAYRRDIDAAYARIAHGSRVVETRCGPIEYASVGEGPVVLAVHGAGGGFDQGMLIGQALAAHGLRVIAMSRFGYLRTPLPADASAAAQADAHACLLDALGIRRAAIVGVSAGAPSSIEFALRHPERCRALVLLVPAAYAPRPGQAPSVSTPPGTDFLFRTALRSDFLFWLALRLAPGIVSRGILATPPEVIRAASAAEQARVEQVRQSILPVRPRGAGLLNDAAVVGALREAPIERITVPTLAISTEDDLYGTYEPARHAASRIPGARFIGYRTGGHLWVGHQEEVVGAVVGVVR